MFTDLELGLEIDPPGLQLAKHDGKGHQLAHARRWRERIGVLLEQDEIGVGIHENGAFRLGFERRGRRRGVKRGRREAGAEQEDGA